MRSAHTPRQFVEIRFVKSHYRARDRPRNTNINDNHVRAGMKIADDFERRGYETVRYSLEEPYIGNKDKIKDCEFVFIAVPTPTTPSGFDFSIVKASIRLVGKGKTAVIKSTIVPGTTVKLDPLNDCMMYRLQYRSFSGYSTLVCNHTVDVSTSVAGIRWYQLKATGATPALSVAQAKTFAPDANARWMGSVAMDKCGNIGVGYSIAGGIKPGIRFAGRLAGDPPNALRDELLLMNGTGSQTAGLNRWGDYAAMRVDPSDDSTFFFTTEYLINDGTFNWSTHISRVQFTSCP